MSEESIKQDVQNILDQCDLVEGMQELDAVDLQFFYDDADEFRVRSGYGNYGGEVLRSHEIAQKYLYSQLDNLQESVLGAIDSMFRHYPEELSEIVIKQDGEIYIHGTE